MNKKWGKWGIVFAIIMLSSCMSTGMNLEPGQVASEDEVFLVGSIDAGVKAEDQSNMGMYKGIRLIFLNRETQKNESILVPVEGDFFVKMPRGNYSLESVFYYLKADHNNLSYINMIIKDTDFDLRDTPMAYMGDIQLGVAQNPYGNYQRVSYKTNNYEEIVRKSEGWLKTEEGSSVKPVDLSSAWDKTTIMSDPFRHQLTNIRLTVIKEQIFIPEDEDFSIDQDKSIAFLSGDMNMSTITVAESLSETAQTEYGVNAISQEKIAEILPLYPAAIYYSDIYNNYDGNTYYYTIDDEEEYNRDLEPLLLSVGNKLGVDYLYLIYWVDGADSSPEGGQTGFWGQNKNTLAIGMRGRLFDVKEGKMLGKSRIMEINKPGFFKYDDSRVRLDTMADSISEDLTTYLYK